MEEQQVATSAIATWASDYGLVWSKLRGAMSPVACPAIQLLFQHLISVLRFRMAVTAIELVHGAVVAGGRGPPMYDGENRGWGSGEERLVAKL